MTEEKKTLTRSELEIIIKRRAAVLLIILAALVAINSFFKDGNSGRIMKDIIAANNQWVVKPSAGVKKALVSLLRFELGVHKLERLGVTHVPHKTVVHVRASVLHSDAFLTLAAGGKHWLELPKFFHG